MSLRIIQTSDIHLGAPFLFLKNKAGAHSKRVISAFKRSIDYAIKAKADLFLIAGDLFHTPYPDLFIQQIVIDEITRLAEAGIITLLLPGNHDYAQGGIYEDNKFLNRLPSQALILDINGGEGKELKELNTRVYSLTVFEKLYEFNIKQDDLINIALIHASVDMGKGVGRQISIERLKNWDFRYIALGDWHGYLEISNNIYYSGSPELLNSDQDGAGYILDVEITDNDLNLKKVKVGSLESSSVELDVGKYGAAEELIKFIKDMADENKVFNIEFKGFRSLDLVLDLEQLSDYLEEYFYHLTIKDNSLFKLSEDELEQLSDDMLIGSYVEHLKTKRNNGEINENIYQQALQMGVHLLKGNNAN
jgi:DNA repair exonuclease SbcCD nuclease subunit